MLKKEKIIESYNRCVSILNELALTDDELVVALAQILIYSGKAVSKLDIDINNVSWNDLHRLYYSENEDNDIGLGLMLNGASMMDALSESVLNSIKGDVTANQGVLNDKVSTTTQVSQESSSTSTGSKKTRRRRN